MFELRDSYQDQVAIIITTRGSVLLWVVRSTKIVSNLMSKTRYVTSNAKNAPLILPVVTSCTTLLCHRKTSTAGGYRKFSNPTMWKILDKQSSRICTVEEFMLRHWIFKCRNKIRGIFNINQCWVKLWPKFDGPHLIIGYYSWMSITGLIKLTGISLLMYPWFVSSKTRSIKTFISASDANVS